MKKLLLLVLFGLIGCSSNSIESYKDNKPQFDIKKFFVGELDAYGVIYNRSGKAVDTFKATIVGSWQGDSGILDEKFVYGSGKKATRVWKLTVNNNLVTGQAEDIKGNATGSFTGNAFLFNYTMLLDYNDSIYQVKFDDWMFLVDQNVLMAKTEMSKFWIDLGEIHITMIKRTK